MSIIKLFYEFTTPRTFCEIRKPSLETESR